MAEVPRVGCDVIPVSDIEHSIATFGAKYLDRIYTTHEQQCCATAGQYAARWAAKEAVLKVLRMPDSGFVAREIEIQRAPWGGTRVRLHGVTAQWAATHGITVTDVSLSHESDMAMAVVVAIAPDDRATTEESWISQ